MSNLAVCSYCQMSGLKVVEFEGEEVVDFHLAGGQRCEGSFSVPETVYPETPKKEEWIAVRVVPTNVRAKDYPHVGRCEAFKWKDETMALFASIPVYFDGLIDPVEFYRVTLQRA